MAPRYLLDTNIIIYLRQKRSPAASARFDRLEPEDSAISVITYGDLVYGAAKSQQTELVLSGLEQLISIIPVLPLPEAAGKTYGVLRAALATRGNVIGTNDLWIAAHALASGLTLVTNNEREFRRIKDLKVENWTK